VGGVPGGGRNGRSWRGGRRPERGGGAGAAPPGGPPPAAVAGGTPLQRRRQLPWTSIPGGVSGGRFDELRWLAFELVGVVVGSSSRRRPSPPLDRELDG
jgi:hypothetical protein